LVGNQPDEGGVRGTHLEPGFLIGDAAAFLFVVLRAATLPNLDGASVGPKFGLILGLVIVSAQAAGAFLAMIAAGDPLLARLRRTPAARRPTPVK
jgi:hypothetical protein